MDSNDAEESIISADDFRTAIDSCCQNKEMKEAYVNASRGARMYLGLLFYQMYFGINADEQQIQEVLTDIEPELQLRDINYLLDNPVVSEPEKQYLRKLRETVEERNESYATTPTTDIQQTPALQSHSLPAEDRKNDEYYPQIRKVRYQKIDHEALKRMEEQRRHKEKLLDIAKIVTKTVAMILVVCVAGWVVQMTWREIKKIEQQKQDTKLQKEFNQKIDQMKAQIASLNDALMAAESAAKRERQRADEMKLKSDEFKRVHKSEMDRVAGEYKLKLDELTRSNEELSAELTQLRNMPRAGSGETDTNDPVRTPRRTRPEITPVDVDIPVL